MHVDLSRSETRNQKIEMAHPSNPYVWWHGLFDGFPLPNRFLIPSLISYLRAMIQNLLVILSVVAAVVFLLMKFLPTKKNKTKGCSSCNLNTPFDTIQHDQNL
jgi:hypothetical protein